MSEDDKMSETETGTPPTMRETIDKLRADTTALQSTPRPVVPEVPPGAVFADSAAALTTMLSALNATADAAAASVLAALDDLEAGVGENDTHE